MDFWDLPGPSFFLENICGDLAEGKNVILGLPRLTPGGLKDKLKDRLASDGWYWQDVHVDEQDEPVKLISSLLINSSETKFANPAELARNDDLSGFILWLTGLNEKNWPVWEEFIYAYQDACRDRAQTDRGLFVLGLIGNLANKTISSDVCLSIHKFHNVVDKLDMTLYAATKLREKVECDIRRYLLAQTICQISLWDAELADLLVNEKPEMVISPHDLLNDIAIKRKWSSKTEPSWSEGTSGQFAGRKVTHTSILLLQGNRNEIDSRVWKAQVQVILPILEDHRLKIIRKMRNLLELHMPFNTGVTNINRPEELEFVHLLHLLGRIGADMRVRNKVRGLRDIRNSLAHIEPLPASQALNGLIYNN